jgi:hypothetical protein
VRDNIEVDEERKRDNCSDVHLLLEAISPPVFNDFFPT